MGRIAVALDVPLRVLFDDRLNGSEETSSKTSSNLRGADETLTAEVVRKDRRKVMWSRRGGRETLLTPNVQRLLEVTLEDADPSDDVELLPHPGEELGYVLEGTFEVTIGDERFVLEAGDSIYLNASIPHAARVIGDTPGRAIWVATPPSF
jgi:quercetin dioxygenase-like cupin family protein